MVFNATFNNISVYIMTISFIGEKQIKLYHIMLYRIHLTMSGIWTHNFI